MKSKVFLLLVIATVAHALPEDISSQSRNPKLFPFLAVVSFPNAKCNDPMTGANGLCYTSSQCTRNGGTVTQTPCAQKYGVCCIFKQSCSGEPPTLTVRNNITQLVGSAMSSTQPCQIKIPRQPGVCQLRLDFKSFNVGKADPDGTCPNDFVSFKSDNLPEGLMLCGEAGGQHLYLHYGQMNTLNINTNLDQMMSSYNIEVTMIKCDSIEKAPDGCTQYFTAPTAEVASFNYPMQQLNSQLYTVCVRSMAGQSIQWSTCPGTNMTFSVSGIMTPGMPPVDKRGDACKTDFLYIPPSDKICGTSFTTTVTSKLSPFFLVVNFDPTEVPTPPSILDDTGCPPGFTCTHPSGMCTHPSDTCSAPPAYLDLLDDGNVGFCLRYTITA